MIMLDMEVISFALDSSANQSAATGSEEKIKIRFTILCTTMYYVVVLAASNYLMNPGLISFHLH